MPKLFYFVVQFSLIVPLIVQNIQYLTETKQGIAFFVCFGLVTLLTFTAYLRVAFSDPGFINSLMFKKAYANNETELSQIGTQQDYTPTHS